MLDNFIHEFAREMEIGDSLPIDAEGVYTLPIDEGVDVLIQALPGGFSLSCILGVVPDTNKEQFLTKALLGNLFGQGTHGSVLGITEDGKNLILTKKVEHTVDYRGFRDILEDFVNTVDFWHAEASAKR